MEDQLKIKMLRDMIRIRVFESALYDLARTGAVPGFLHLCLGQEAVAVGCCSALQPLLCWPAAGWFCAEMSVGVYF